MEIIGTSTLFTEKYRPQTIADYITTPEISKVLTAIQKTGDIPNLLLYSRSPGTGKTTFANVVAKTLDCDLLYINASLETSIENIRYNVTQFTMTSSLMGGKKLVVLDEAERLSGPAQEALKVLIEQTESNARFILCTNNMQRIVPPVISRCQVVSFEHSEKDIQGLMVQYFKRLQFVLSNEGIEYDKAVLAELVKKLFPDMRKCLNELQKYNKMHGKIDEKIFGDLTDSKTTDLITKMKARKFADIREACSNIDPSQFFIEFYGQITDYLQPECIPNIILIIARYANMHCLTVDTEINLCACIVEVMQEAKWR